MKIGAGLYLDGRKIGEIIHVNALVAADSKNPVILTSEKATQYFVIAKGKHFPKNDHSRGTWEVGDEAAKRRISVSMYSPQDDFHLKLMVELRSG
jgi:hypothetical protein